MAAEPWRETPRGIQLQVRVTPRAARDAVEGLEAAADGALSLKLRVRASPTDGAANEAVRRLLAGALALPPSAVTLVAGQAARRKVVELRGDPARVAVRLRELAGPAPAAARR